MKKPLLILIATCLTLAVSAQNNLVSGNLGLNVLVNNGSIANFDIGVTYDRQIGGSTIGIETGYGIGNWGMFYLTPSYNFYITEAFNGLHVGPAINLRVGSGFFGGTFIGGAANLGYMININGSIVIDPQLQLGYGAFVGSGGSTGAFQTKPSVRVGFLF